MKKETQPKNIYIVGNANETNSINHLIGSSDIVIRFNRPNPSCTLKADILFFANMHIVKPVSPIHRKKGHKTIFRERVIDVLSNRWTNLSLSERIQYTYKFPLFILKNRLTKISFLSPKIYLKSMDYLSDGKLPSSGFMAVFYAMKHYPNAKIILHNFTFEGWDGHDFKAEKQFIQTLIEQKKIYFIK